MHREPAGERYSSSFNPRNRSPGSNVAWERSSFGSQRDGTSSSSIFGTAYPVDTAARERAIEERLKEKQMKEQEPIRGRKTDRQHDGNQRDISYGSGGRSPEYPSGGLGCSSEF